MIGKRAAEGPAEAPLYYRVCIDPDENEFLQTTSDHNRDRFSVVAAFYERFFSGFGAAAVAIGEFSGFIIYK